MHENWLTIDLLWLENVNRLAGEFGHLRWHDRLALDYLDAIAEKTTRKFLRIDANVAIATSAIRKTFFLLLKLN